jgi:hypothetical protein
MRRTLYATLVAACLPVTAALAQGVPGGAPGLGVPGGAPGPGAPGGAPGQGTPAPNGAQQVVGLFMQSCVHFAGDAQGLRNWLAQQQVPQMQQQISAMFLTGRPGVAYDASVPGERLAVVSANDRSCSAYADMADPAATVATLEAALRQSGISARLQGAPPDQQDPTLQHREYAATIAGHRFLILTTTTTAPNKVQAALTLRPQ